jgi:hypothetical protein
LLYKCIFEQNLQQGVDAQQMKHTRTMKLEY